MAELKTKKTDASVDSFINQIKDQETRRDCFEITKMMQHAICSAPKMWGSSIIGFGSQRLKYASGRELDWMLIGFSPRKANITLYLPGVHEQQAALLKKLGKYTTGKGCVYIKRLKDVDVKVLKDLINRSLQTATGSNA